MDYGLPAAFAYALFLAAGSVSVGYAVLRLSYPEVRVLQPRKKAAYSVAAGALLFAASVALDSFYTSEAFAFHGYYFTTAFVACLLVLFAFKIAASLSFTGEMLVALPTPSFLNQSSNINKMRAIKQRVLAAQTVASPVAVPSAAPQPPAAGARSSAKPAPVAQVFERRRYARVEGASVFDSVKGLFAGLIAKPQVGKNSGEQTVISAPTAKKGLLPAPKPRKLTVEEEAALFAEQAVPRHRPGAPLPSEPRWKRRLAERNKGAAVEPKELQAFLGALQKSYSDKHAEAAPFRPHGKPQAAQGGDEFNLLVQDVYTQLKDSKSAGLASSLDVKHTAVVAQPAKPTQRGKKEEAKPAVVAASVSMADLFGSAPATVPAAGAAQPSIFDQLGALASGAASPTGNKPADSEFVKVKAEKGMGCPSCGARNTRVVFCPYCGTGFCANCTPSLLPGADAFTYTCPKCSESVSVKKKSA